MIWPEFENENSQVIDKNDIAVNRTGTAQMWIIAPEYRDYHVDKIKVGLKGYFMEGSRKIAECEVLEIIGLNSNPTQRTIKTGANKSPAASSRDT